jgi:cardiolipin synthase
MAMPRIRPTPTVVKVVVVIALLIGLGLLIAQDQANVQVQSPVAATDVSFAEYAGALTGTGVTHGDEYEILVNGDAIFPPMLAAIDGASRRISFETYIFDKGDVAGRFTSALAAAARRGVEVRLLVDAVGAKTMERQHAEALEAAGVQIGTYNPLHWYNIEELNYRTHRKILVVDGEVGFTGGAGVADHWRGSARDASEWRDTHLRVTGPAVTMLEAAFWENWVETSRPSRAALDLRPPDPETRARSIVVWSSPTGGVGRVKLLYLLSIAAARRTLDIASPYVVLDESTRWSLLDAARRGVKVRLLVEGDLTDAKPVKYASRADYEDLLAAGIEIHESQPTMMHVKATIVDGSWSIVGSTNFDNRSLELNDEINVGIAHAGVAARLLEDFDADLRRSRRLVLEQWRQRPMSDRGREQLWRLFGELF